MGVSRTSVHSVLIVGSSSHESLESSYARALKRLGCSVQFWQPVKALHEVVRGRWLGRLFSTYVNVEPWARKANLQFLQLTDRLKPDLILVIGTSNVRGGTLAQVRVRLPNCLIYCIYPDSPHNLDNDRIHCLPFFDLVTTSSPAWIDAFKKLGAKQVHYLPFAADTDLHHPLTRQQHFIGPTHEVGFIGTWRPDREAFLEQFTDFDICIWGSAYWKKRTRRNSPLRARWSGRQAIGTDFARVCARTKIMLNILDAATWPGPNMRTFEQPACRAFSLVTRSPAVVELFQEGETVECFDTGEEARDKISYYIKHEDERRRLAQASYHFVIEGGHTYIDRARQLLNWVAEGAKTQQQS